MDPLERRWAFAGGVMGLLGLTAAMLIGRVGCADPVDEQLRLAWAEGIPTNGEQFQSTLPSAPAVDNAALIYRQLSGKRRPNSNFVELHREICVSPTPMNLATAKLTLASAADRIKLLDQATALPRCVFERNWSQGAGVLMPEYADMKSGSYLLGLRGSVAVAQGRSRDALADARRMLTTAKHAGEEPVSVGRMVMRDIYDEALMTIASWAAVYPKQPSYRAALAKAISDYPKPNPKEEYRDDLFNVLSLIEMCNTSRGLRDLGIKTADLPREERFAWLLHNRTRARVQIIEAERELYSALGEPTATMEARVKRAIAKRNDALEAFPTARSVFIALWDSEDPTKKVRSIEARRLQFVALLRTLEAPMRPGTIRLADILSPFDGQPISSRFDGRTITIEVSGGEIEPLKVMKR